MSSKLFNILVNKGRSLYIHDYEQISAQVSAKNKSYSQYPEFVSRSGQNPDKIAVATKFVDGNTY